MGQVSVGWVEVEATGNVCHAQGEMCAWEEEKGFLWSCSKAGACERCCLSRALEQHLPGLSATKKHVSILMSYGECGQR